jgi:N-acetylglucosaminyldiphosphoundecaprenol N-acetyl-beta-D-mannosaminyltransferase
VNNRYKISKIKVSQINLPDTLSVIYNALINGELNYICVTNSRTTYLANNDENYCRIQNNSLLTVPDGKPLVWVAHNLGYYEVGRVSGKDLMDALFEISEERRYSHYFYGSTQGAIDLMKENILQRYPDLDIKGAVSPPFQPLESFDIDPLAIELNDLRPTFFWCGLGAPKQERLIAALQPKLDSTISVGVGLAFEYFAGTVVRAPRWMQNLGFEGIYRLSQQPRNISREIIPFLWIMLRVGASFKNRYFRPNSS